MRITFDVDVKVDGKSTGETTSAPGPVAAVTGQSGVVPKDVMRRMFDAARDVLRAEKGRPPGSNPQSRNVLRRAMRAVKAAYGPRGTLSDDNT